MSDSGNHEAALVEQVRNAFEAKAPIRIRASGSKHFLAEAGADGDVLDVSAHRGVVSYDPGELVLTARAGTTLTEIEQTLADANQWLAFEPPHFGPDATLGGTIAAGLAGPARPFTGSARDFVLGMRIINGRGQALKFGGEVMKNVAGYDLSRLMAGAFGTLGVLLEISLKVLPRHAASRTLMFEHDAATALRAFSDWNLKPWPITAGYWDKGQTYLRLAGAESSVNSAAEKLGGEHLNDAATFWTDVREHRRDCFAGDMPLWRLSLPPATPMLDIDGDTVIDWAGAQRWLASDAEPAAVREAAARAGGHASVYRGTASPRMHPLPDAFMRVQQRVKASLDPAGILNPGRLYPDL